ncbi:MAG: DUF3862 domain-containing protein [Dysgonamonadaceae bacterium]|jgi:hypothetical protein|nr:DUF3862 domain-containing protein [Dysgonamonadaceae bacterium]
MKLKINHFFSAVIIIAFLGLALASGSGVTNTNVTKENYEKLTNGMNHEQVIEIMGEADSKSEIDMDEFGKTELWHWQLGTKAIDVTFENGKVANKSWVEI